MSSLTIDVLRQIAGQEFSDMPDAEIMLIASEIERKIRRPVCPTDKFFGAALAARRTHLQRLAGVPQPRFAPEMYGRDTDYYDSNDSNEQGEP